MTVSWLAAEVALLHLGSNSFVIARRAPPSERRHHHYCPETRVVRGEFQLAGVAAVVLYFQLSLLLVYGIGPDPGTRMAARTRLYTTCPNTRCKGTPQGGTSWRFLDKGEPNCRQCGAKFDLSRFGVAARGPPAAGRHPAARAPSGSARAPKDPLADLTDEQLASLLRQRFSDEDRQAQVDFLIPPMPKTPAEVAKEAYDEHQTASAKHIHEGKVLGDMRVRYAKMCRELVEYKGKIQAQEARAEEARVAKDETERRLQEATAADSSPFPTANTAVNTKLATMATELNKFLNGRLAQRLPADEAGDILSTIASIVEKAATPPPPPHYEISSSHGGEGSNSNNGLFYDAAHLAFHEEQASMAFEASQNNMDSSCKRGLDDEEWDEDFDSEGDCGHVALRQRSERPVTTEQITLAENLASAVAQSAVVSPAAAVTATAVSTTAAALPTSSTPAASSSQGGSAMPQDKPFTSPTPPSRGNGRGGGRGNGRKGKKHR